MNKTKNSNEASAPADKSAQVGSTANGYDCRWVEAINHVLESRETGIQIDDIDEEIWDSFLGPMIDAIEDSARLHL
jgi:hypothetical protein